MRIALALVFAVGMLGSSVGPSLAQGGGCDAYCTKRCTAAQQKAHCMGQCVPACNQNKSKKK